MFKIAPAFMPGIRSLQNQALAQKGINHMLQSQPLIKTHMSFINNNNFG
jgi:hypothetical protein